MYTAVIVVINSHTPPELHRLEENLWDTLEEAGWHINVRPLALPLTPEGVGALIEEVVTRDATPGATPSADTSTSAALEDDNGKD